MSVNGWTRGPRGSDLPGWIRGAHRSALLESQRGRCAYCRNRLRLARMTIDHLVPASRGGSEDLENLVASCHPCNSSKANSLLSEWPMFVRGGVSPIPEIIERARRLEDELKRRREEEK